eukprot:6195250-Pleurochrysis_carterae.AAC.1
MCETIGTCTSSWYSAFRGMQSLHIHPIGCRNSVYAQKQANRFRRRSICDRIPGVVRIKELSPGHLRMISAQIDLASVRNVLLMLEKTVGSEPGSSDEADGRGRSQVPTDITAQTLIRVAAFMHS